MQTAAEGWLKRLSSLPKQTCSRYKSEGQQKMVWKRTGVWADGCHLQREKKKKAAAIKDHLYGAIFQCKYSKDQTPNRLSDDKGDKGELRTEWRKLILNFTSMHGGNSQGISINAIILREFAQRRFSPTQINRKWAFFSLNMSWRYQIWRSRLKSAASTSGWRASLKKVAA